MSGLYASYWNAFLLPPANEVWDKVIFSQTCVKNSVYRGQDVPAPGGGSGPGGVPAPGGGLVWF